MKGVYKYSILEEFKLIIQFYQNDITLDGLKKMEEDLYQDKGYNSNFKILVDLRLSNICMTVEEVEDFGKWIEEKLKSKLFSANAILTTTPQQVSLSTIFDLNVNLNRIKYEIFSSLQGSLKYLEIDIDIANIANIEIIENEIEKMKEK